MPSSSLFLTSSTTLLSVLSLFSASAAADSYQNVDTFTGSDFVNEWNYFSGADPTHGFTEYIGKDSAVHDHLVGTSKNGNFFMSVDSSNPYNPNDAKANYGYGRPSVRIESQKSWSKGLFVADLAHMPDSICGVWPAWWTLSTQGSWPQGGEIDIIEGVSNRRKNLAALHTSGDSSITGDSRVMSGNLQGGNCNYNSPSAGSNPSGCAIIDSDENSFGTGFNKNGRIVAMEWTDDHVKVWNFDPSGAPSDIKSDNPNPDKWPKPAQAFTGDNLNMKSNFDTHRMIFDTTFCGDFTNAVWASEGCAASTGYSTCQAYVGENPGAFEKAYWEIAAIKVYQKQKATSTTTSTTTTSPTTSPTKSIPTTSPTKSIPTTTPTYSPTVTSKPYGGNDTTITFPYPHDTTNTDYTYPHDTTTDNTYTHDTTTDYTYPHDTTTTTTSNTYLTPAPSDQTTAAPHGGTGFPMGGASYQTQWGDWSTPDPEPSWITTTMTTTYVVPCPTGMETKTATVTTKYVGGKPQTHLPVIPYTTAVTTCPVEWGFGGPITVTLPVTSTITYGVYAGKATDDSSDSGYTNGNGDWNSNSNAKGDSSDSSSSDWSGKGSSSDSDSDNGKDYSYGNDNKSPAAASTSYGSNYADPSSTWMAWSSVATPAATVSSAQATGTGYPNVDWAAWGSTSKSNSSSFKDSGIKTYTGAASKTTSSFLGLAVAGIVGLLFF